MQMAGLANTFLVTSVFLLLLDHNSNAFPYPYHASCKIEWNFGFDCPPIINRVMIILREWSGPGNCIHGGERCLYTVTSVNGTEIRGYHESPKKHYIDDIKFQFVSKNEPAGCIVKGYSRSQTWYALLDQGTNYCNLHNVIIGADLDRDPAYMEFTDKAICTQYDKADCDVY